MIESPEALYQKHKRCGIPLDEATMELVKAFWREVKAAKTADMLAKGLRYDGAPRRRPIFRKLGIKASSHTEYIRQWRTYEFHHQTKEHRRAA